MKKRERWPHVSFWICFVLVFANIGLAAFAQVVEIAADSMLRAGGFGLLALFFWVRCASEET